MTPVIIVQPAAQRDLAEIADYFAERSLKLALRFAERLHELFTSLRRCRRWAGFASSPIRISPGSGSGGFKKYLVYYRARHDGIEVLRVLHAARDIDRILGS